MKDDDHDKVGLKEHPKPTIKTVKGLYARAFRCAHPNCERPLYLVDDTNGKFSLNSNVCHIKARRERGPRWDEQQSAAENRGPTNLIVMCVEHSRAIDQPENAARYTVEVLQAYRQSQISEYNEIRQNWRLTSKQAKEVKDASFNGDQIQITNSSVQLGGEGGRAPGAGGGGGGAVGRGAHAGDGGAGGPTRILEGEFCLPFPTRDRFVGLSELLNPNEPPPGVVVVAVELPETTASLVTVARVAKP